MNKEQIEDAISVSSPEEDANVDSSTTIESGPGPDSTSESKPEAQETETEIRDDAPLKNQIGELQRRLDDAQSNNQQLMDSVFTMEERYAQKQAPQAPQVPVEVQSLYDEASVAGLGKGFVDKMLSASGNMAQGMIQQSTQQNIPAMQANIDIQQETRVNQIAEEDARIKPYKGEIMDMLRNTPLQTRNSKGIVDQAVAVVAYKHRDEMDKTIRTTAKKEADKRRRVEGEVGLSGTSVKVGDSDIDLTPEERELGISLGKSDEWMAETKAMHLKKKAEEKRKKRR